MPIGFNLFICCFFLCLSGLLSPALRRAGIRPGVASVFCVLAAFFGLLEDIAFGPIFFVNPGGFLIPLTGCLLLLWKSPRMQWAWTLGFAVIAGLSAYIFTVLCSEIVSLFTGESAYFRGLLTVLLSCALCADTRSSVVAALLGFYLSGAMAALDNALTGISTYAALGSGVELTVVACITPAVLLIRETAAFVYRQIRKYIGKSRHTQPTSNA